MSLKSIFNNLRNRGLKDVTDPKRIRNYFDGETIKKEGIHLDYEEIMPYAEQLVYRSIVCRPCFQKGECEHCQCTMPLGAMVVNYECSGDNFGTMKSPEEWEKYKKKTGLRFVLKY
jgi:hypothetical protein